MGTVGSNVPEVVEISSATIGAGGSLGRSLDAAGVSPADASAIERALRPWLNARSSRPADRIEVFVSSTNAFARLRYWPKASQYYEVNRSTAGIYTAQLKEIPLAESLVGVGGQVRVSLWDSMTSQEVPPEMIYRFAEIFGWRIDFLTEPRQGDTYKVVWRRRSGNGAFWDDGIVTALYQSRDKGDIYAFSLDGEYYDSDGDSLRGEFLRAPLAFRRISSRFTNRRFHPILRYYRPHHGIDYSAARGTPVQSIAEGVVVERGYKGGLGNEIRIRHAGSYVSIYGHLMGYARGLHVGQHVKQGQLIGYVGSTGLSTGPHLHFGFEHGGQLINFLGMKVKNNPRKVPSAQRAAFAEAQRQGEALLGQLGPTDATVRTLKRPS